MIDEPLFSPRRIWGAIKMWFYLAIAMELDISLWHLIKYCGRPNAAERDRIY
jgi:hypothetical protein